ncbi:hypothetical protein ACSMX9_18395 [Streptomyces sp. LE64]|uniref:hypothetical protein n=1 Tax=Streptomyces sp. LE64 TaxID=3448653 RepID=UPI004043785F
MRKCTAAAEVPHRDVFLAILAGQGRVSTSDLARIPRKLRCELGLWHEGEHADHVWDWDHRPSHALWVRWSPDGAGSRLESLPWCEAARPARDEACTLYWEHDHHHSWELRDPEYESLARWLSTTRLRTARPASDTPPPDRPALGGPAAAGAPGEGWAPGRCWLYCGGVDLPVTWIGPVRVPRGDTPMYACADCTKRLATIAEEEIERADRESLASR